MEGNTAEKNTKFKYLGPVGKIFLVFFIGFSLYLFISTLMVISLTKSESEIRVPDVVGKPFTDVYNSLARRGLNPEINFKDVFDINSGIILSQYPETGKIVSKNSSIKLEVSRSNLHIDAPNLIGKELPIAINKLKNLHLHGRTISIIPGIISYIPSSRTANNIIIAQSPAPEELITPEIKVNLLVSAGKTKPAKIMPSVLGQSIDLCYDLLSAIGVEIKEDIVTTWDRNQSGRILSQTPYRGNQINPGDTVKLKVKWYPLKEHPYIAYEKFEYNIPEDSGKGLYEAYIEDHTSRRIRFSQTMKTGGRIQFVFHRTGNAKITITKDKKVLRISGINVE